MELLSPQAQALARAAVNADAISAPPAPPLQLPPTPQPPQEFLNRDVSWLEFNRRVLHEALDERTPLLERLRFLGIFTHNLDEFYMKRIGALKRQVQEGTVTQTPEGLTPAQNLAAIRDAVLPMIRQQAHAFNEVICPALAAHNVHLLSWEELT